MEVEVKSQGYMKSDGSSLTSVSSRLRREHLKKSKRFRLWNGTQTKSSLTRIMLDNMVVPQPNGDIDVSMLREAVALIDGRFEIEASGNVTIEAVDKIGQAGAGVTFISCGALTHSVKALEISLKIDTELSLEVGKRTNRAYKTIEVWCRILQSLEDKFLCGK